MKRKDEVPYSFRRRTIDALDDSFVDRYEVVNAVLDGVVRVFLTTACFGVRRRSFTRRPRPARHARGVDAVSGRGHRGGCGGVPCSPPEPSPRGAASHTAASRACQRESQRPSHQGGTRRVRRSPTSRLDVNLRHAAFPYESHFKRTAMGFFEKMWMAELVHIPSTDRQTWEKTRSSSAVEPKQTKHESCKPQSPFHTAPFSLTELDNHV